MKLFSTNSTTPLNREIIQTNITSRKETTDSLKKEVRIFTAADLWNIQKQRRVFTSRRFI